MTQYLNTAYDESLPPLSTPICAETFLEFCDACGHAFGMHQFDYHECGEPSCPCVVFIKEGERWLPGIGAQEIPMPEWFSQLKAAEVQAIIDRLDR